MKHSYLLTIALFYSASIICAAEKKEQTGLTFYLRGNGGATPIMKHHIKPDEKESFTGKTYQELFDTNACAKNIPWLVLAVISLYPGNFSAQYFDFTELIKKQIGNKKYNFSTSLSSFQEISQLVNASLAEIGIYPNKSDNGVPHIIYYAEKNNMKHKCPFSRTSGFFSFLDKKTGETILLNDTTCTLSISFNDDYSQLLPLLYKYQTKSPLCKFPYKKEDSDEKSSQEQLPQPEWYDQKSSFWKKTFHALPYEQKKLLTKEFNEHFSLEEFINS